MLATENSPKKRLIIDMDGVIADIYLQFISYEFEENGIKKNTAELSIKH